MNPLRTVAGRLALSLLLVVGGALTIVYLTIVPSFHDSLVAGRLKSLRATLALVAAQTHADAPEAFPSQLWVEREAVPIAAAIGVRVVLFRRTPALVPVGDSNGGASADVARDPLAREASRTTRVVSGQVTREGATYAEAAVSLERNGPVLLLAGPLRDQNAAGAEVRRRVLIAGTIATIFAIVLGFGLARLFARRIRRLEVAAELIAGGRFDAPVTDPASDELGQLARAFDRMRLRLASLERARSEFIANASHELRTPLFSLAGFLELLADEELPPETRDEFLGTMRDQVSRLSKLATELLDLSRIDAGRLSVATEPFELSGVAETLETEFGPRAAAGGHVIVVAQDDRATASADEARVLQIGRILVENALVHTPAGTTVRIVAARDGDRCVLQVTDDGPGIPADAQHQVFERFYRLDGTVAYGSGLGLAIAQELSGLMGGSLELASRAGTTTFTLVLPGDAGAWVGEAFATAGR